MSFYINTLIINIQKLNDFCSAVKSQKHLVNTEILVETFYINTLIINIQKMNDFSSEDPVQIQHYLLSVWDFSAVYKTAFSWTFIIEGLM